ncbi:hypothetical protein BDR03DRAFT_1011871 [Suillus americanus]|nr:hypothetical protein BDR03DRAFT_1011871 [Suillus americanus]
MPSTGGRPAGPLQPQAVIREQSTAYRIKFDIRMHLYSVSSGLHKIFQITIDLDKHIDNNIRKQDVEHEAIMNQNYSAVRRIITLAKAQKLGVTKLMDECAKWEDTNADEEYIDTLMTKVLGILEEIIVTSGVILKSINPAVLHSNDTVPLEKMIVLLTSRGQRALPITGAGTTHLSPPFAETESKYKPPSPGYYNNIFYRAMCHTKLKGPNGKLFFSNLLHE